MSALGQAHRWLSAAKSRRLLICGLTGLPLAGAVYLLALRFLSSPLATGFTITALVTFAWLASRSTRKFDNAWLIRQLDERLSNLEDSSDLLFKPASGLSVLQSLQRERVEHRIAALSKIDLCEPWPAKIIALSFLLAIALSCLAIFWPQAHSQADDAVIKESRTSASADAPLRLLEQNIDIHSPAYTGLPERREKTLQVKFPEGANLNWNLTFNRQPASVNLLFHDGSRLVLKKNGDIWQGSRTMLQSSLYRIQANEKPLPEDKLYRLDAIRDLAPQLRVIQPDRNLSLVELGQTGWPLGFEAEDDYGLGTAQLRIQLAQGSGENIKFTEQTRSLAGQGSQKRKRFSQNLDLTALGLHPGDDVIVQFSITDQRWPQHNTTRSSSFILRWPPEDAVETTGVEGLVQKAIPAYFRSQRQIIIDTEKLLAERKKYTAENFVIQSDTIGVDQRILRLRYGQFLGEEAEGEHEEHADEAPGKSATAGDTQSILEQYGHTHDIPEAATLLEPKTRELLRSALNEMWQAELNLRQGKPKEALPYEYRALAFIKKVQQADRIYLARVGNDQPPIDETRRLSGDRGSLGNRDDVLQAADADDLVLVKFWQSLNTLEFGTARKNKSAPDFQAFRAWMREHASRSPDALGLLVALDALEKQPDCRSCLAELKTQLWPLLPRPAAQPQQRRLAGPDAQKYLDALQRERKP